MVVFFKVTGIIFLCMLFFLVLTNPYANPYKLIMIFGKKGSGKSTLLTRYAMEHIKKGWTVYSTEHIPGVFYIHPGYIGRYALDDFNFKPVNPDDFFVLFRPFIKLKLKFFPKRPKVLLLIDEVGMIYDNRNYKNFSEAVRNFFKLQRHYHVKCIMFSQTFDVDKKLRDLTDAMYLVKNFIRVFSYGKKIIKRQTVSNDSADGSGGKIVDEYEFEHFFVPGSRTFTFIPRYSGHFNSHIAPELPHMEFEQVEYKKDAAPDVSAEIPAEDSGDASEPEKNTDLLGEDSPAG